MKKFILLMIIIVFLFSCGKKQLLCVDEYQFKIPFKMYAKSDTIAIGDTIFLDIAFPVKLENKMNGETVNVPAEYFKHYIDINKITDDSNSLYISAYFSTGGLSNFDISAVLGEFSTNNNHNFFCDFNYLNENDSIFGKYIFIAKDTGTYIFRMTDYFYYQQKSMRDKNGYVELNLNPNECKDHWRLCIFENQMPTNYYIAEKRGAYIFTEPKYDYQDSYTDNLNNFRYGSFSVVVK